MAGRRLAWARRRARQFPLTQALAAVVVLLVVSCGEPSAVRATNGDLLGLFDLAGQEDGHFEIEPGLPADGRSVARVKGRFWVLDDGTIRTAAEINHEVVDVSVSEFLSRPIPADREPAASLMTPDPSLVAASLRDRYRGDDFRLTLADLALPLASASTWVATDPSVLKFMDTHPETAECPEAMAEFTRAVRAFVADLRPRFVPDAAGEVWMFPVAELQRAVSSMDERLASACSEVFGENEDDHVPKMTLRLHRSAAGSTQVVRVLLDDGQSDGANERELFQMAISRLGEGGQRPPEGPSASMVDNYFLLKINECGRLPWQQTIFMESSYEPPDDDEYVGPGPLTSDFLCESELPPEVLEQQ